MIAYLPSQWSWEFLHNVKGSRVRIFRMVDMCKGIKRLTSRHKHRPRCGLHMVGIEDIVLKQQGDISLHFSNHRIPSFIFSSQTFFFFLSFSFPNLFIGHFLQNIDRQISEVAPWIFGARAEARGALAGRLKGCRPAGLGLSQLGFGLSF